MPEFKIKKGRVAMVGRHTSIAAKVYVLCEELPVNSHVDIECTDKERASIRSAVRSFSCRNNVELTCSIVKNGRGKKCVGIIQYA